MKYRVETTSKLDNYTKRMIKSWIDKNLIDCENPR